MIQGFACTQTRRLWVDRISPRHLPSDVSAAALRRLAQLHAAAQLSDLRSPPGNHLEALRGDRRGQHSVRINRQWRICFVWSSNGPDQVEIVDYH